MVNLHFRVDETNPSTCLVLNLLQRNTKRIIAGTTLYLYEKVNEQYLLRQGHYKLLLWPNSTAQYSEDMSKCQTNGLPESQTFLNEFKRLILVEKLLKEYDDGFIEPEAFQSQFDPQTIKQLQYKEAEASGRIYVFVKLANFLQPIIYKDYMVDESFVVAELEPKMDPVERFWKRYRKMFGEDPKNLEPSASAYDYLMALLSRPISWNWSPEHRALFWKYRYWLCKEEHALPKFLQIIDWDDREEVSMVSDLLLKWEAPSTWTCLELMAVDGPYLSEDIDLIWAASFSKTLYKVDYDTFELLLLCILQYFARISKIQEFYPVEEEEVREEEEEEEKEKDLVKLNDNDRKGERKLSSKTAVNLLADLLIEKALEWPALAQKLFWSAKLGSKEISTSEKAAPSGRDNIYARLLGMLLHRMQKDPSTAESMQQLFKQEHLFKKMCSLFRDPRLSRIGRPQRINLLKELTGEPINGVLSFTTLKLPYDANTSVTGTLPDKLTVFKSTAMPVKVSFVTTDINEHVMIVKAGEDLRQDVFVINLLRLFDLIWQRDGLDLRLTPYRCMALSLQDGILEFVPSEPLSNVIEAYGGNLLAYLSAAAVNPSLASLGSIFESEKSTLHSSNNNSNGNESGNYVTIVERIPEAVMETYVRSCAGYCVFTYVLGIGDRHLDNLLLTKDGRIFHIDFTYIFGKDPKPFPPPMKLCKEMVEAMGGPSGVRFGHFKSLCFAAFSLLRRHSRLIIPYLSLCTDVTATKYVQDRLMLNLEELDALLALQRLIDESMNALFPKVFETLHKWAQYWRP